MRNSIIYNIILLFRFLGVFFLPGALVILATFLVIHFNALTPWLDKIEMILPYGILALGVILGWMFHRSRLAFVIVILFLSERSLFYFGAGGSFAFGYDNIVLLTNGILLPINIVLFYFARERGLFNLGGIAKTAFILLQPLLVYLLLRLQPDLFQHLSHQFIKHPQLESIPLTQPVLLVYGSILLIFFTGALFGRGPIIRGFFWALVSTLLALVAKNNGQSATLYYSAAGLIIIISVIETAYAMAFQDELTGLPARRALNTSMNALGRHFTIAMLDIDFFKKFNDRYGHDVGDQVLCMVASHIRRVGGGGKPYRYGGEEFTILFPGKRKEEVIPHLERLRQSIEAAQFGLRGKKRPRKPPRNVKKAKSQPKTVSVTISIGVAEPSKNHSKPTSVLKAADQALYRAKKRGRNCITA
jgi:diguanylate cyclase (GGDEF)-like protein